MAPLQKADVNPYLEKGPNVMLGRSFRKAGRKACVIFSGLNAARRKNENGDAGNGNDGSSD